MNVPKREWSLQRVRSGSSIERAVVSGPTSPISRAARLLHCDGPDCRYSVIPESESAILLAGPSRARIRVFCVCPSAPSLC